VPASRTPPPDHDRFDELLEQAFDALDSGAIEQAARRLDEAAALDEHSADLWYARGLLAWHTADDADEVDPEAAERAASRAARQPLERALHEDPDHADALHLLARCDEIDGDRAAMIARDLRVLELDARADQAEQVGSTAEQDLIASEAEAALDDLPEEFKARLANVPIVLEARPSKVIVREGFDPRALGLFEGPDDAEHARGELVLSPSRIVLFYANLLVAFPDEDDLREQVRITIFHEVGHYFGLDEDEIAALGLD
jgi:predicted Zn-dependent protease with MMP-like domain